MILMQVPALDKAFASVRAEIDAKINLEYKKQVKRMFVDLLAVTPQWSGNYASNWWITTDPTVSYYTDSPWKGSTTFESAGKRGDERGTAKPTKLMNLAKFDYKKPVYFLNNTPTFFDEDTSEVAGFTQPYEGANYPSQTKVRPANLVDGRIALQSYMEAKYK